MKMRGWSFVTALVVSAGLIGSLLMTPAAAHVTNTAQSDVQLDWVRNYSSGFDPEFAFAHAVAPDGLGNVYVTGSSYGPNGAADFATVKYSNSGDTLWVQRYNGPEDNWDIARALVVDAAGNVYVTGESYGSEFFDYVTIKYSASGTQEWVARYNGSLRGSSSDDRATDIAVDASGNVYVTGSNDDYLTIKYDSSGTQQWVAQFDGGQGDPLYPETRDRAWAVAVDGSGNVYVTGDSGEGSPNLSDYVTVKYNSSGDRQWVARYTESYSYDYARALALDAEGNVYVTGSSFIRFSGTFWDYATVKYDSRGRQRWVRRYQGGNDDDQANALAVDASGNVYVTGESGGVGTFGDYATIKYNTRGKQQWVARYDGPEDSQEVAVALAVDASGNVYVTGWSNESYVTSETGTDYATLKYSNTGVQQWVAHYNGPENTFDDATALAIDGSGNVYVTGRSHRIGGSMWTTIKYVPLSGSASP
jgi:Beta-propeller repeat